MTPNQPSGTPTGSVSPQPPAQPGKAVRKPWPALILTVVLILSLALLRSHATMEVFFIPSGAMEPTLQVGDKVFADTVCYRLRNPRFQEVSIFRAPPASVQYSPVADKTGEIDFIKRCIGLPGDVVYSHGRSFYRKPAGAAGPAQLLHEPYLKWSPGVPVFAYDMKIVGGKVYSRDYFAAGALPDAWSLNGMPVDDAEQIRIEKAAPGVIPQGEYLMLGDHRNNSNDSHAWGLLPRANFLARGVRVFWPPQHNRAL